MNGYIKSLKPTFGFVKADDGSEYFFLPTATVGVEFSQLKERQRVTFATYQHEKGARAKDIQALD